MYLAKYNIKNKTDVCKTILINFNELMININMIIY